MIITEKEGLTAPGEWDSLASQLLMGVMCPTLLLRVIRTNLPQSSPSRDSELVSRESRNCVQDKVRNSITKVGESHAMWDDNQNYTGSCRRPLVEGKNLIIGGTRSRRRRADRQTDRGVLRGIMGEQTFYVLPWMPPCAEQGRPQQWRLQLGLAGGRRPGTSLPNSTFCDLS